MTEHAITVKHVSKTFKLPHERTTSIKSALVNLHRRKKSYELQQALKDVSFSVKKGEFFGIVGRNGSGKSTLLKLLAGIYAPDEGDITVHGKLTPFIELGVGFNPELTGRENVYLNGALLGFNHQEVDAMYDEIVAFAELEKFMDQKLKNYSSGMQVRLAFSIAIRAKSDVLLIDEVLAVGDTAFQRKCYEIFTRLKKEGRTIVFITHDMAAVERFCDRVMVIHNSKVQGIFTPSEATVAYDKLNASRAEKKAKGEEKQESRWGSGEVRVKEVVFMQDGKALREPVIGMGEQLQVKVVFEKRTTQPVVVGLGIEDVFGVNIAGPNSIGTNLENIKDVVFSIDKLPLLPGEYKVTVAVFDTDVVNEYDHLEKLYSFNVTAQEHHLYGKINLFGKWSGK